MTEAEITSKILRQLRDDMNAKFDSVNARLDQHFDRLDVLETLVHGLAQQLLMLTAYVKTSNENVSKRAARLEKKAGR